MAGELVKAKLIEVVPTSQSDPNQPPAWEVKDGGKEVTVQFNPDSLKVTYANQVVQPEGGDQGSGTAGRQFVGAGTTKLALQLWFDVTAMQENAVDDVRRLTEKVVYFMKPQNSDSDPTRKVPPGVRFSWGSFLFDGIVEGMEETIEFFSPQGKPLRASISLTLTQQKILDANLQGNGRVPALPGHTPLASAKAGDSLQNMAAKGGKQDWQSIAAANQIEDPLRLKPGQMIDLNAGVSGGVSLGAGASLGISAGIGGSLGVSAGLNAALGGSLSGSFNSNA